MKAFTIPRTSTESYFLSLDKFRGGSNTLISEARLQPIYATFIRNLQQVQDGIWKTRPGLSYYGNAIPSATSIDSATTYKNGSNLELIAMAVIGGVGKLRKSTDNGSTWSAIDDTKTFTAGIKPNFIAINSRLYISNGTDPLTYYDGSTLIQYTAISNPTTLTAALTTLTTGTYTNYYKYVAVNSVGFTVASSNVSQTTNKARDTWSGTEKVTLTLPAISGATGYQVFWGDVSGGEQYIGETSGTTYEDFGATVPNPYIDLPDDNTTGAPKFQSMEVSGNRMWGTKISSSKWRVYASGTGIYMGVFSPFYGGMYIDIEKGGINVPQAVVHYRTGKGDPVITVICSDPFGNGTIFQIEITSTTVDSTTFTVPVAFKIVGATGGDSPYFVTKVNDDVVFGSKKRISSLKNKQQIFNVLSTEDMISGLRNEYESLNHNKIDKFFAFYKTPRIYFSMVKSSTATENDITAVFDTERNNWNWYWDVGFKHMFEYADSTNTRTLIVPTTGAQLSLLSDDNIGDYGSGFYQEYLSPLLPVNNDITTLAKIREVIYEVGSVRGTVYVEVVGIMKGHAKESIAGGYITEYQGSTGFGVDLFSGFQFSGTSSTSVSAPQSTRKKTVRVNKKLYAIQFRVYTSTQPTRFELLKIQAKGFTTPSRPDQSWN